MRKAIILAGGQGTRLHPVTLEIPKPLVTVNRKPIINYLISLFHKHGVEEAAIVIRPKDREEFEWWHKRWLKDLGGVKINFFEEPRPRGTIGHWARELRHWTGDEPFFYTNGDELKDADYIFVEGEGRKIGDLMIPAVLWKAMNSGTKILISRDFDLRAKAAVEEYLIEENIPKIK